MKTLRALAALSFVALAGCQSRADLEAGRHYACDPAAGGVDQQCPGGWVCLLDGYCQDPAVGVAAKCSAASDCTGGWHCGAEGQCYDRASVGAVTCRQGVPQDCRDGWHCGVDNVCYDRATAGDVECRQDVPEDCAPGWRCGLEGKCHDVSVGAAYRCDDGTDTWCEQGWRCGPHKVCVDARAEALRPFEGALEVERISPVLPAEVLEVTGSGSVYLSGDYVDTFVFRTPGEVLYAASSYYAGTVITGSAPGQELRAVAAAGNRALWLDGEKLWSVRHQDGETWEAPQEIDVSAISPVHLLRAFPENRTPVAVTSGARIAFLASDSDTLAPVIDLGAGYEISDVADSTYRSSTWSVSSYAAYLYAAATEGGIFIAWQDESGSGGALPLQWTPVDLPGIPNSRCGTAPTLKPTRVRAQGDSWDEATWLAVEVRLPSGASQVSTFFRGEAPHPAAYCPFAAFEARLPPTDLCDGHPLADFHITSYGLVVARCATGDPARPQISRLASSEDVEGEEVWQVEDVQVILPSEPVELPVVSSGANPNSPVFYEPTGRFGACDHNSDYYSCAWLTVDRPPAHLLQLSDGGVAPITYFYRDSSPEQYLADQNSLGPLGFHLEYSWYGDTVAGNTTPVPTPCGTVRGMADLVTFCVPGDDVSLHRHEALLVGDHWPYPQPPAAILTNSEGAYPGTDAFPRPQAVAVSTPDGGTAVAVAAFDAMWLGEISPDPEAPISRLTARIVPQVRGEITSLALAPYRTGGPYFEGYVIAQERLYHLTAGSQVRWSADPLLLPDGRPLKVWTDGARGRVGFEDGRVFSLPSAVQIGEALPTAEVIDFGELCGHAYALTPRALLRLDADPQGGPVGVWTPVPLDDSGFGEAALRFDDWYLDYRREDYLTHPPKPDLLVDDGRVLYLFTRFGAAIRITDPVCSQ